MTQYEEQEFFQLLHETQVGLWSSFFLLLLMHSPGARQRWFVAHARVGVLVSCIGSGAAITPRRNSRRSCNAPQAMGPCRRCVVCSGTPFGGVCLPCALLRSGSRDLSAVCEQARATLHHELQDSRQALGVDTSASYHGEEIHPAGMPVASLSSTTVVPLCGAHE